MIAHGLILLLLVSVLPIHSLICYECDCTSLTINDCFCGITTNSDDNDHCVIIDSIDITGEFIQLDRIPTNSTWLHIKDPYYILAIESIRYNLTTTNWYLAPSGIIFGCDWDYCNTPNLITSLPQSMQLAIDRTWLDANIYGTGSTTSCHYCPQGICADPQNPFDISQCPLTLCNNVTSCLAYDIWDDLGTGEEQCVYSECAPAYLDGEFAAYYGGKYRIDMEAIVYLEQNRSKVDIWEIDIYCAAPNCTRPTIFQEISQQVTVNISDLSGFPLVRPTTTTAPPTTTTTPTPLECYSCVCFDTTDCSCIATVVTTLEENHCIILRENLGQLVFIELDYFGYYQLNGYVNEFPHVLVKETISYDENGGRWYTTPDYVIYGCNWNLCNKPELVSLLPNSFQMRLPEVWLNSSILGNNLPVRDCHECPGEPQCGTTDYLDASTCPIQPCNTTCFVSDTYDDPANDYLCYQSYCLGPDSESYQQERHTVEIEGIIYASQPNTVEIWEIDIFCRADNCSRPGIFRELHQQLTLEVGSLATLFNETHDPAIPQRRCYDCYCYNPINCSCDRTTIMPANTTYCLIMRENLGQESRIFIGHIDEGSTRNYIRDFPYLLVEESIIYIERTGLWNTITNYVLYGCDWDYCNHPDLVKLLPTSFQMRLPETWLNTSVLGTGQSVRNCHQCPTTPVCTTSDTIDSTLCPVATCNATCLIFDSIDDPENGLQCYQSYCASPGSDSDENDRHRVELEGILYLQKEPLAIELWEADIYCRADDCARSNIFTDLKSQLFAEYGDLSEFYAAISTPSPTTLRPSGTTSPTSQANISICVSFKLFIILLISIFVSNFY